MPPIALTDLSRREGFNSARRYLRWWRAPWWLLALFTGAKSFADNPLLGSPTLNAAGLHVWRLRAAHALTRWRRARLARLIPEHQREQFDRDGFLVLHDVLPPGQFQQLQQAILTAELECRAQQQGDTITRRVPFSPELGRRLPALAALLRSPVWTRPLAYIASTRARPLYYLQSIFGGAAPGPPDPQFELHSDTFHPSLKAWFFLTDVDEDGRPLTYVAGSHRLSEARIAWERRKSIEILKRGDRLSQRGSFRVQARELTELGLPQPTRFCVPANTLVIADTCGFHARADSDRPTTRVELWAYCRRNPFLPWTGMPILLPSWVADRRVGWLYKVQDALERHGLAKQHWKPAGRRRPTDL